MLNSLLLSGYPRISVPRPGMRPGMRLVNVILISPCWAKIYISWILITLEFLRQFSVERNARWFMPRHRMFISAIF